MGIIDTVGFTWHCLIYRSGMGNTHHRYGYGVEKPDLQVTCSKPYGWLSKSCFEPFLISLLFLPNFYMYL